MGRTITFKHPANWLRKQETLGVWYVVALWQKVPHRSTQTENS